ncbi:hypothetical protein [Streptomyces monashensis]|uniref:hypothetical protein n=1 Tax=Streptomyces monashensis TaxID=1678012 RepID=UPI001FEBE351|nr:hypothetical protein [Streptomyces monashensis]
MTPIRAQFRTAVSTTEAAPDEATSPSGVRRGRHRKPRPRRLLLAAGGLALAAGALSLVRVASDPGTDSPATAEADPRATATTEHAANTAATVTGSPTAPPSATAVMGGRNPAPTRPRPPAARPASPTVAAPRPTPSTTPPPTAPPTPAPPAPTTTHPTPTTPAPAPSRSRKDPGPGGLCVPVIGLCVDTPGGADGP